MGTSCSHTDFDIHNINPTQYTDKALTWHFQVADAVCNECDVEHIRAIKKTCVDHRINQPWEILAKASCKHDIVIIKDKTRDVVHKRYNGRAHCVCCLNHIPVFITFEIKQIDGKVEDIQTSVWSPDKIKTKQECEQNKKII